MQQSIGEGADAVVGQLVAPLEQEVLEGGVVDEHLRDEDPRA